MNAATAYALAVRHFHEQTQQTYALIFPGKSTKKKQYITIPPIFFLPPAPFTVHYTQKAAPQWGAAFLCVACLSPIGR